MKKSRMFLMNLLLSAVQTRHFLLISLILIVIGALWYKICLYIGLAVLGFCVLLCLFHAIRIQRVTARLHDDDPEFGEMMDSILEDSHAFISDRMAEQDKYMELHGEELYFR